jgi:hypothetical protein
VVREKELLKLIALEKSEKGTGSRIQFELADIDLARARLLLEQAERALTEAEKKSPKKSNATART